MSNITEVLSKVSFYPSSSDEFKNEVIKNGSYQKIPKGTLLFNEGDACKNIGVVGTGRIRVSKTGQSGREVTLYNVRPGEGCVLNLSCAFANTKYPAVAVVEETSELVVFPANIFQGWLDNDQVRKFVFDLFSNRLTKVITLVEEIVFRKMDQRLTEFLLNKFENNGRPVRYIHLTQEQIATDLGTAREVVNRLLKELERSGAVQSSRGKITLLDENILTKFI
jgi:CRP/FNR family transcriptional regulator